MCLVLLGTPLAADELSDTEAKISTLQKSIAALKRSIDTFTGKQKRLKGELRAAEQRIRTSLAELKETRADLHSLEQTLAELESRARELEQQRLAQQEAIAVALRAAYRQSKQNRLKLILNQQNPADVQRLLKYYDIMSQLRQDKIDRYLATLAELQNTKREQLAARAEQARKTKRLEAQHAELELAQQERREAISELEQRIGDSAQKLANQELERDKLQGLLDEIRREMADLQLPFEGQPFSARKGSMAWPLAGKRLNAFGSRKPDSSLHWQGIVIQAEEGTDVRAIHEGRVVYADWFSSQGLMVLIDHGERYMSLYAHNASIYKQTGDLVSAGERIASAGNSGGQTDTGLYFEIRRKGEPVDPAAWCR